MGLTRAAATVREARGADPTLPWGSSYIPTNGQIGFSAAGVPMNDDQALSIDTVASCIRLLVDTISPLPLVVLKQGKNISAIKVLDPPPLIQNPWPEGTMQDWLAQVIMSLALRGNFFGQIVDRDDAGYPLTIMPVHPDDVIARRDRDGKRSYKFCGQPVPLQDVLHIPGPILPPGGFIGLNPVEYRRQSWALAAAAEKYGGQFFANSATPSGIISTTMELSPEEAREWAMEWRSTHGGIGNAHLPMILTGDAKFQAVQIAPEDAQFLQTRSFQREQIIAWYGIPPHRIGITDRTPTSGMVAEDLEAQFMRDAIFPYTSRIANYLSLPTFTRPSQKITFDYLERLRPNSLQRAQVAQIMVNTGQWMPDEGRSMFDLEALPNNLGRVVGRPMNNTYFDADSGEMLNVPDPSLKPPNPGGLADGGGNPDGALDRTLGELEQRDTAALMPQHLIPELRVEAPNVNVQQPDVFVSSPEVHVAAPDVRVDAPNVTVEPTIQVAPSEVRFPEQRLVRKRVVRDKQGRIKEVIEEFVD